MMNELVVEKYVNVLNESLIFIFYEPWNKVYCSQHLFNVPNKQFHGTCCHCVFEN
jgi:hypothetical protein